jgi:voltage-gated potassium channel
MSKPTKRTFDKENLSVREKWSEIIFGHHTKEGKAFDVILLWAILLSILAVILESVKDIREEYGILLTAMEWTFTILFSVEYILRIFISKRPFKYIFSFYGIVDLLSTIPTYLAFLFVGPQYLATIRIFRLLRVFRVLKLTRYMGESRSLGQALIASRTKIIVFIGVIMSAVVLIGTIMYIVEGQYPNSGFTSIPRSIYWAIVTITTVGYGDIAPQTAFGQFLSAVLMILGYAIIAVPTGIVTSEMAKQPSSQKECSRCGNSNNDGDARFCKQCGEKIIS